MTMEVLISVTTCKVFDTKKSHQRIVIRGQRNSGTIVSAPVLARYRKALYQPPERYSGLHTPPSCCGSECRKTQVRRGTIGGGKKVSAENNEWQVKESQTKPSIC